MEKAHQVLEKYFGYQSFRDGQAEIIEALLKKQDVMAIMPTGAGKSLCYQIPALLAKHPSLVISPLISLMKDQVANLKQLGLAAAFLNSSLSSQEQREVLKNFQAGKYHLLYLAPEQLISPRFLEYIQELDLTYLFVDEAHCLSQWGPDFRPSYLQILDFVKKLNKRPTLGAFTATATQNVKEDIIKRLEFQNAFLLTTGFDRKNLFYSVKRVKKKFPDLSAYLKENKEKSGIIYCLTRKSVEKVTEALQKEGFAANRYHAGLEQEERQKNQEDFANDKIKIMVATNAFGMGIDKSNISFVIHYNMPKNLESYYQETGRAGRDSLPADCILYFNNQDIIQNRAFIADSVENENMTEEELELFKKQDYENLKKMTYYCFTNNCLRRYILNYFNEASPAFCGNCSNCLSNFEEVDITIEAQKILSCILRMKEKFGLKMLLNVLQGKKTERILALNFHELSTFNLMPDYSEAKLRDIVNFLLAENYIRSSGGEYPILQVEAAGKDFLFKKKSLKMKMIKEEEKEVKKKVSADFKNQEEKDLFAALQKLRKKIADEQKVPAYIIFHDSTLKLLASVKPKTSLELSQISGVGAVKLERYGKEFLEVINSHLENSK